MIFDPKTREMFPGVEKHFPGTDQASGSFYSTVPATHVRKHHINPNASVKACQDKGKLMELLQKAGVPTSKAVPVSKHMPSSNTFSILDLEEDFGDEANWAEKPFQIRTDNSSSAIHGAQDVFDWFKRYHAMTGTDKHTLRNQGIFVQPQIIAPKVAAVTAMPTGEGLSLRCRGDLVKDGIFPDQHQNHPQFVRELGMKAVDELGLDYGTAVVLYDPKTGEAEILDVDTRLRTESVEMLYSLIQIMLRGKK